MFLSVQKELRCLYSCTILSREGGKLSGEVLVDFWVLLDTRLILSVRFGLFSFSKREKDGFMLGHVCNGPQYLLLY